MQSPIIKMMRKVAEDKIGFESVSQIDKTYFNNLERYKLYCWIEKSDPVHQLEVSDDANADYGFGAIGISSKNPFLPSGASRHHCISEQFGYLQLKTIIATFVRILDFELEETAVPKPDYTSALPWWS